MRLPIIEIADGLFPSAVWFVSSRWVVSANPTYAALVTFQRRKILCDPENVELLRAAFRLVKSRHPFTINAFVLLPEHLHCIWTLPPGDRDYPMPWSAIKNYFSRYCPAPYKTASSAAQQRKREQTLWQRRYWEHQIRDQRDFERHCDYVHWNPV